MKAVGNIRRITRTMQMIAASKFAKAQHRATASKPYSQALFGLVAQLADAAGDIDHPLLASGSAENATAPEITLIITSNRGLCGPYNGNVIRTGMTHLRANDRARNGQVESVGRKGANVLRFNQIAIAHTHEFGDEPRYEEVERLAQTYIDAFSEGRVSAVRVVYMRYISAGKQRPEVLQLLPFDRSAVADLGKAEETTGSHPLYEFIPSPEALLDTLLPAAVKSTLFQCFNDAIVSEHVARMVAMKSATDNAGKLRKALQRKYNRARQAMITTEITEIVGGAAALE